MLGVNDVSQGLRPATLPRSFRVFGQDRMGGDQAEGGACSSRR
jgi:hypothetical protein